VFDVTNWNGRSKGDLINCKWNSLSLLLRNREKQREKADWLRINAALTERKWGHARFISTSSCVLFLMCKKSLYYRKCLVCAHNHFDFFFLLCAYVIEVCVVGVHKSNINATSCLSIEIYWNLFAFECHFLVKTTVSHASHARLNFNTQMLIIDNWMHFFASNSSFQ
jgi:hypothetical protein